MRHINALYVAYMRERKIDFLRLDQIIIVARIKIGQGLGRLMRP